MAMRNSRASLAIDNLRAIVILLVLGFHSVLAYLTFLPAHPFAFAAPPFLWRSFPVVDSRHWIGFDVFCAWLDCFLMSFFFLLSGLFAWPSLMRKGAGRFLADRLLRLGVPFAVVVVLLMPVAHYPVYLETATDPGLAGYLRHWLALPLWPAGPMWFLWLLLVGDLAAAALFCLLRGRRDALLRLSFWARRHPARFLGALLAAAVLAYVPLALAFGPFAWVQRGPFSLQLSRPLHYALYFFAGVAIGACGIELGLAAPDASLARRWARWLLAAPPLLALWLGLTALTIRHAGAVPVWLRLIDDFSFAVACFANSFGVLAVALRFAAIQSRVLDSLKANAYGMYLVHYVFVVWLQYALLPEGFPAVAKAAIVFGATVLSSWGASAALRRLPAIARVIGADRRAPPAAAEPLIAPRPSAGLAR
jgi:peptidoglycan/LPS O-acetylase OafA/YrhL